jgi:hypothetical protein
MIRSSCCRHWQRDAAAQPAQEHSSYTTRWDTIARGGSSEVVQAFMKTFHNQPEIHVYQHMKGSAIRHKVLP